MNAEVDAPSAEPLDGPPYVQVVDSQYCSSAWDENCCDLPNGHDELHWDKTNGNRWRAEAEPSAFDIYRQSIHIETSQPQFIGAIKLPRRWPSVGYKRAIQGMIRFLLFLRADDDAPKRDAFKRAGGRVICDECGQEFNDHVQDPIDPWLNVLCSGERVKL